jgi:prophage regulatory protein
MPATAKRRILRRNHVRALTGLSDRSIDRFEKRGEFPRRVILSPNAVGWFSDEIDNWISSRRRGNASAPVKANDARRRRAQDRVESSAA